MPREQLPYRLKKIKSQSKNWYYKLRGWKSFKTTGKSTYPDAVKYVENEILGKRPRPERLTLKEFSNEYFKEGCPWLRRQRLRENNIKLKTVEWRRYLLEVHILPYLGSFYLDELTPSSIENMLANLKLSSRSVNHVFHTLMILIKDARRERYITWEIDKLIEPPRYTTKATKTVPENKILKLFPDDLGNWISYKAGVMCAIMVSCGLRSGEVRALSGAAVKKNGILVLKAVNIDDEIDTPKANSIRAVPAPKRTIEFIDEWKRKSKYQEGLLFPGINGGPIDRKMPYKHLKRAAKDLGIEITAHGLRHTYNTRMRKLLSASGHAALWSDKLTVDKSGDELLRKFTGHKSEDMTELYDHPDLVALLDFYENELCEIVNAFWNIEINKSESDPINKGS